MTGRQSDKLTMLLVVLTYLKKTDAAVLAKMPHIVALIEEFEAMLATLSRYKRVQGLNRTGIRVEKLRMRGELTALTLNVAFRMAAYAKAVGAIELGREVCFKEHLVNKYRESCVADLGVFVHDKALGLLSELAPYGVTVAVLAELKEATDEYDAILPKTRAGIVTRMTSTGEIKKLFGAFDVLLEHLDALAMMLRFSDPWFYLEYFRSRKVIRRGTRKNALQGTVRDEDGTELSKVTVTVVAHATIVTQSGEKGNYLFRRLPGGVWPVTFSRLGYVSETVFLASVPLLRQELHVVLKRQVFIEEQA